MSRFMGSALLAGALLVGFGACGGGDSGGDSSSATTSPSSDGGDGGVRPAATILLQPATFKPEKVTIKAGETVRWRWGGGVQHDVVGDGFESKLQSKGTFDHTFDTAGTYPFKCNVHPTTMKGTVTVEG